MSTEIEINDESSEAKVNESLQESDTSTMQVYTMRQSPLDITVIMPTGKKLLIVSVSPSEPTSFIKQNLQDFQESALYSNYVFETVDKRVISDYVEIANYAPTSEDICAMTIHLVPAQYDVRKSRQQLKRVRDIIAFPPTITGVSIEKDDVKETNTDHENLVSTEAVDLVAVEVDDSTPEMELESAVCSKDSADEKDESALEKSVVADKIITSEMEKACDESSEESKEEHSVVSAENGQVTEDKVTTQDDLLPEASEKKQDFDNDASNTASNEVKETSTIDEECLESKVPVEVKPFAYDDDGIKVSAMDDEDEIVATETPRFPIIQRELPSEEEIFAPLCLGSFFKEVLLRVGSAEEPPISSADTVRVKDPSECVKSVSASGWNPPPMSRASQGDLLYIEAVTGTAIKRNAADLCPFFNLACFILSRFCLLNTCLCSIIC